MAETALAVLGLIAPAYEAISKIWHACREMTNYGREMLQYWRELNGYWAVFDCLMSSHVSYLKEHPDLASENHALTSRILEQLRNLEEYFSICHSIFDKGRVRKAPKAGNTDVAATTTRFMQLHNFPSPTGTIRGPLQTRSDKPKIDQDHLSTGRQSGILWSSSTESGSHETMQHLASTLARWTWVHHDKEDMEKARDGICRSVNLLRDILNLRVVKEPQKLIPGVRSIKITATPEPQVCFTRNIYMNVHRALREVNKRSRRTVSFAISALDDFEDNWNTLDNDTKLRLRPGSAALWLQMHVFGDDSTFLMAEVRLSQNSTPYQMVDLSPIEDLDTLPHFSQVQNEDEHYEFGALTSKYEPTDKIHVFAQKGAWRKQRTLHDILTAEHLRSKLSNDNIVELCLNIAVAHRNLADVRAITRNVDLKSYVFYQKSIDSSSTAQTTDFDISCPYLQFGFGQPLETTLTMGAAKSAPKHVVANIVELGLVLFQVASQTLIPDSSPGSSKIDAKAQGLINRSLTSIEARFGEGLSSTIGACLQGNPHIDDELTRKAIDVLEELKGYFLESS
jgi:hypothetical protein